MQSRPIARDTNAHRILFDPDDSRPVFIGLNQRYDATTTALDWEIFAFTYSNSTSTNIIEIRKRQGAYDDRATLLP